MHRYRWHRCLFTVHSTTVPSRYRLPQKHLCRETLSHCRHEKNGQKLGYSHFSLVSLYWNATRNHLRAIDKDNVSLLIDKGSLSQYRASTWSQTLRATSTLWARFVFWVSRRIYMSLNYHKLIFHRTCMHPGPSRLIKHSWQSTAQRQTHWNTLWLFTEEQVCEDSGMTCN